MAPIAPQAGSATTWKVIVASSPVTIMATYHARRFILSSLRQAVGLRVTSAFLLVGWMQQTGRALQRPFRLLPHCPGRDPSSTESARRSGLMAVGPLQERELHRDFEEHRSWKAANDPC